MGGLDKGDLEASLDLVLEAYSFDGLESFRAGILPSLRRLVPADSVGYNEIDLAAGRALGIHDPPDATFAGVEQLFLATAYQHPGVALAKRGDHHAHLLSDFLSAPALHRLELYQDVYRRLETEDQLAFGLPSHVMVAIAINRSRRTFRERDRDVIERVRPHLAQAYVQAREREDARAIIDAQDAGLDERDAAVIVLDPDGSPVHASPLACQLLAAYFPGRDGGLPVPVVEWLQARRTGPRALLVVTAPRGRLRVRDIHGHAPERWRALLLDEQRASPPTVESLRKLALTRRQAQVLRLLACGKSTHQIAEELFVSPATVRKHLEHIYARLGVQSRTEAVAVAIR
jgi:DNA-binding CsgD family transcriptional regulator